MLQKLLKPLTLPLAGTFLVLLSLILIQGFVYSPFQVPAWLNNVGSLLYLMSFIVPLIMVLCTMCSVPLLLVRKFRKTAAETLIYCFCSLCLFLLAAWGLSLLEEFTIRSAIARAKPLLIAIAKYESIAGHPPSELSQLVPAYLDNIPGTGIGACTTYKYMSGKSVHVPVCVNKYSLDAEPTKSPSKRHDDRWMLELTIPSLMLLEVERIYYLPTQSYDREQVVKVIEGWAFDSCPSDALSF